MNKVIAALDNMPSARGVLEAGTALARRLGATIEAVHVKAEGVGSPTRAAGTEQVQLRVLDGHVAAEIVEAAGAPDVVAIAIGSRAASPGPRPAGHIAMEVVCSVNKPVLVVPPDRQPASRLHKLLVPLNGDVWTSEAIDQTMPLIGDRHSDIIVLHVLDASSLPPYDDQSQHETPAWRDEFVRRHCEWSTRVGASVELRVGVPAAQISEFARAVDADLVVVGWSRDLSGDRAPIVRELLSQGRDLLLLVPVAAKDRVINPTAPCADTKT